MKVRLANSDQLFSEETWMGVKVSIQGVSFTLDLFVLELIGCDWFWSVVVANLRYCLMEF